MSKVIETMNKRVNGLSDQIFIHAKKFIKTIAIKGKKISYKSRKQIEIEKLKWDLRQKNSILGEYVYKQKISKSVTDFSHDQHFLDLVNDVNRIKIYIEEIQKEQKVKTF